jgi:hypothetical protein
VTKKELLDLMAPLSFLDRPRLESLHDLAVEACALPGLFVECGCGRGGSTGVLAGVLAQHAPDKTLIVCDTFEGLPPPNLDLDRANGWSRDVVASTAGSAKGTIAQIAKICSTVGPGLTVHQCQGLYGDTLPILGPGPIALLHADADWYYSTKQILDNLYDDIVPGGIIIFDDYHFWSGCKLAVNEFFCWHRPAPIWSTVSCAVWGRKPIE